MTPSLLRVAIKLDEKPLPVFYAYRLGRKLAGLLEHLDEAERVTRDWASQYKREWGDAKWAIDEMYRRRDNKELGILSYRASLILWGVWPEDTCLDCFMIDFLDGVTGKVGISNAELERAVREVLAEAKYKLQES